MLCGILHGKYIYTYLVDKQIIEKARETVWGEINL